MGHSALQGFSPAAGDFFRGLAANNTRDYWLSHKAEFEKLVHAPFESLLAALPEPYTSFRAFRMNRDIRFSSDKAPYKTAIAASQGMMGAVRYLQFGAEGMLVAVGAYLMAPDQLDRYRHAVDSPASGQALDSILADLPGGEFSAGAAAPLVSAPRGYAKDHPRIELLRLKGVAMTARLSPQEVNDGDTMLAGVLDVFRRGERLHEWVSTHVGASDRTR